MKNNIKNIVIWSTLILILVIGIWWYQDSRSSISNSNESIKIGVIAPLTGRGASRGESSIMAFELAKKKIKERGLLDKEIELVFQDVPLDQAKRAPGAFNQLVEFESVVAIIGPMGSNVVLSITPLVDAQKIPVIIHTASISEATKDNEFVFRIWPTDKTYADAMIPEIKALDYEKIAILTATTDNTLSLLDLLGKEIDFVINEKVSQDLKDFRTQIAKIKSAEPDVLILNLYTTQNGLAAKQAREAGLDVPFITNSVTSTVDLEVGAKQLEGAWLPQFAGYGEDVKKEFEEMFGRDTSDPDSAAAAHDSLLVLAQAIGEVGTDGGKIKDYIYNHKFSGSIGDFSFAENGDGIISLDIKVVKNGNIVDRD